MWCYYGKKYFNIFFLIIVFVKGINMYKKKMLICILIISLLCIVGCSKNNTSSDKLDYYDNSDNLYVDVVANDGFSFDINFVTKEKIKDVKYLSIISDLDTDVVDINVINNTIDSYSNYKYKDFYCADYMFDCTLKTQVDEYIINGIVLEINGQKKKLEFKNPIKYKKGEENTIFNENFQVRAFANGFSSSMINSDEKPVYKFYANKKLTIEKIETIAGLNVDVSVFLNNDKTKYELPLEVEEKTEVIIEVKYTSDTMNSFSYVLSNLNIVYSVDGTKNVCNGIISFNPTELVSNDLKEIDNFIDYMISE